MSQNSLSASMFLTLFIMSSSPCLFSWLYDDIIELNWLVTLPLMLLPAPEPPLLLPPLLLPPSKDTLSMSNSAVSTSLSSILLVLLPADAGGPPLPVLSSAPVVMSMNGNEWSLKMSSMRYGWLLSDVLGADI